MQNVRRHIHHIFVGLLALGTLAGSSTRQVKYIPYADARLVLEALAEGLPAGLRDMPADERENTWPDWVKSRDIQIRERLSRGDEDTLVNFLFFGTTYTHEPRLTSAQLRSLIDSSNGEKEAEGTKIRQLLGKRLQDLVAAMAAPGNNERLLFARSVTQRVGIDVSEKAGRERAGIYLYDCVLRVTKEQDSYKQAIASATSLNDPTEEFAERSKLYKERGLSLDTSLPPNYALEVAFTAMHDNGLLARESVHRIGIIGPGLDFTDKQEGYDFYPMQTLQPFAVMNSLLRLGLAQRDKIEIDALDLSSRVNEHIERAVRRATHGLGYTLQVPRDPAWRWKPDLIAYWKQFGDQIGSPVTPISVPAPLRGIELRAVRVRPEFVRRLHDSDVNIVLQREDVPEDVKFDLLIATNVLVYYDTFEQSLALANIEAMLRPGGFLLTNNLLLELPSSKMKGGDYVTVEYSDREADGDRILWYRREP